MRPNHFLKLDLLEAKADEIAAPFTLTLEHPIKGKAPVIVKGKYVFSRGLSVDLKRIFESLAKDVELSSQNGFFRPATGIFQFKKGENNYSGYFGQNAWFTSDINNGGHYFISKTSAVEVVRYFPRNMFSDGIPRYLNKVDPSVKDPQQRLSIALEQMNQQGFSAKQRNDAEGVLHEYLTTARANFELYDGNATEIILLLLQKHPELLTNAGLDLEKAEIILSQEFWVPYEYVDNAGLLTRHSHEILRNKLVTHPNDIYGRWEDKRKYINYGVMPEAAKVFHLQKMALLNNIFAAQSMNKETALKYLKEKFKKQADLKNRKTQDLGCVLPFYVPTKNGEMRARFSVGGTDKDIKNVKDTNKRRKEANESLLPFYEGFLNRVWREIFLLFSENFLASGAIRGFDCSKAPEMEAFLQTLQTNPRALDIYAQKLGQTVPALKNVIKKLLGEAKSVWYYMMATDTAEGPFYQRTPQAVKDEETSKRWVKEHFGSDLEFIVHFHSRCGLRLTKPAGKNENSIDIVWQNERLVEFLAENGELLTRPPHIKFGMKVEPDNTQNKAEADFHFIELKCTPAEFYRRLRTFMSKPQAAVAQHASQIMDDLLGLNKQLQLINNELRNKKRQPLLGHFILNHDGKILYQAPRCFIPNGFGPAEKLILDSLPHDRDAKIYSLLPAASSKDNNGYWTVGLVGSARELVKQLDETLKKNLLEIVQIAETAEKMENRLQLGSYVKTTAGGKTLQQMTVVAFTVEGSDQPFVLLVPDREDPRKLGLRGGWVPLQELYPYRDGPFALVEQHALQVNLSFKPENTLDAIGRLRASAAVRFMCEFLPHVLGFDSLASRVQITPFARVIPEPDQTCDTQPVLVDLGTLSQAQFLSLQQQAARQNARFLPLAHNKQEIQSSLKDRGLRSSNIEAILNAVDILNRTRSASARPAAATSSYPSSTSMMHIKLGSGSSEEKTEHPPAAIAAVSATRSPFDLSSQIRQIIRSGQPNQLIALLEREQMNPNLRLILNRYDAEGCTCLHVALLEVMDQANRHRMVNALLMHGANFNTPLGTIIRDTGAMYRPYHLDESCIPLFLQFSRNPRYPFHNAKLVCHAPNNPNEREVINTASQLSPRFAWDRAANLENLKQSLNQLALEPRETAKAALMSAITFEGIDASVVKALIEEDANFIAIELTSTIKGGVHYEARNILHWAVFHGNEDLVQFILNKLQQSGNKKLAEQVLTLDSGGRLATTIYQHPIHSGTPLELAKRMLAANSNIVRLLNSAVQTIERLNASYEAAPSYQRPQCRIC